MSENDVLFRKLAREKNARKQAETILEQKSSELYQVNLELKNLAKNLSDKEKRTRAILEATADGIIVLNKNNVIEICNKAASNIFSCKTDELLGKNIISLLDQKSFSQSNETIESILANPKENTLYEISIWREEDINLPVELSISNIQLSQETLTICVLRNIFERKLAENRLTTRHEITRILSESFSLEEAAPKILKIICMSMKFATGILWEVDSASDVLRCITHFSLVEDAELKQFTEISKSTIFKLGVGFPGKIWASKTSCWITDIAHDLNFPRVSWAQKAGLRNAFGIPLLAGDEVKGIIEFFTRTPQPFDDNLLKMLNDITNHISMFIDRETAHKRSALARRAGMADMATSILHNVGNILNSANVSLGLIIEYNNQAHFENFFCNGKIITRKFTQSCNVFNYRY